MQSRFVASVLNRLRWLASPAAGTQWLGLAVLSLVTVLVMLVQHFVGLPFETKIPVGPTDRIAVYRQATGTYRWKLPSRYNNPVMDYRAVMLEDGKPMSQCYRGADVADIQATHFYIHNAVFLFGNGDATDVRKNGHRYEVRLPTAVRPEWLAIALGLLALSATMCVHTRTERKQDKTWRRLQALPARLPAWTIAVAVLAIAVTHLVRYPDNTSGPMLVKGVPESDAAGWHDLGQRLAEGKGLDNGFGAQRPLYAVLLGALSVTGGPALVLGKGLNAVLIAIGCMGIFMLGRAMRSPWAGLGAAAYLALADDHLQSLHMILTETPGLSFGIVSSLTLVWAVWRRSVWGTVLAGVVTGICSLSSGELILAVPLNAILIASLGLFRALPWRSCFKLLAAFTVGTSLLLLPWMSMQKARFGIFTLTMNTPELLSGGADPEHGKLDIAMHKEANEKGFDASNPVGRYRYFSERFAKAVKADPFGYVKQVLNAIRESLSSVRSNDPTGRLLVVLTVLGSGLVGAMRWRAAQPLLLTGALLLFLANEDDAWPAPWLTLAVFALVTVRWRGRPLLALGVVLTTVLACMFLCGLSGNVASRRFWNVADWALVLLWLVGWSALLHLIFLAWSRVPLLNWGMARPRPSLQPVTRTGRLRGVRPVALGCTAVAIVALGIILVRHQVAPAPAYSVEAVTAVLPAAATGESQSQLVKFDDYIITLGPWEHAPHWRPYYTPVAKSRWIARPRIIRADGSLGGRIILEGVLSQLKPPSPWQTMICTGKSVVLKDPLSGGPVPVLHVVELKPVDLKSGR